MLAIQATGRIAKVVTGGLAMEVRNLIAEVRQYRRCYSEAFAHAVEGELSKLASLGSLEPTECRRIRITVYDAARCYYSARWWGFFGKSIKGCARLIGLLAIAVLALSAWTIALIPRPALAGLNGDGVGMVVVATEFAIVVSLASNWLLSYGKSLLAALAEGTIAIVAIIKYGIWSHRMTGLWNSTVLSMPLLPARDRTPMEAVPVAHVLVVSCYPFAVFCVALVACRFVNWQVKAIASGRLLGYGRAAEQCASLLLGFVDISHFAEKILADTGDVQADGRISIARLPREHDREELESKIERQARIAKGAWKDAMRAYRPRSAGEYFAKSTPRICLFLQYHQVKTMFAGSNLIDLKDAMERAIVWSADQNWQMIGPGDEFEHAVTGLRWKRRLKRTVAVIIPIVFAILAELFARGILGPYVQGVIFTCLGFAVIQLLALIDPDLPGTFDIATQLAGRFSHGGS